MTTERPTEPWRPTTFKVFPVGRSKSTQRAGKTVRCWDVRGRVDSWDFARRFTAPQGSAEAAKRYAQTLGRDFENTDKLWDPKLRRFVDRPRPEVVTVFSFSEEFWARKVGAWEPGTKRWSARALCQARRYLLADGYRPTAEEDADMVHYMRRFAFVDEANRDERASRGRELLRLHSIPIDQVKARRLEEMLVQARRRVDGIGDVEPVTEARFIGVLRDMWRNAVALEVVPSDPWPAVERRVKSKSAGKVKRLKGGVKPVKKELVLSPAGVLELAAKVSATTRGAGVYEAFVATMGLCGTRPGETMAVQMKGLELTETGGWLTVGRSSRKVPARFLDEHDDPEYGPLKGLDTGERRTVPVPSILVPILRHHIATYRADAAPDDLLFVSSWGRKIDPSRFSQDYWRPAVDELFPEDSPLRQLRRHDLRHAACSAWLHANVPLKLACTWSGHAQLSVFLDVYQGIMPGGEAGGVEALERYLATILGGTASEEPAEEQPNAA
jgi:integrase